MGMMFITALFHWQPQSTTPQSVLVSHSQLKGWDSSCDYNYTLLIIILQEYSADFTVNSYQIVPSHHLPWPKSWAVALTQTDISWVWSRRQSLKTRLKSPGRSTSIFVSDKEEIRSHLPVPHPFTGTRIKSGLCRELFSVMHHKVGTARQSLTTSTLVYRLQSQPLDVFASEVDS